MFDRLRSLFSRFSKPAPQALSAQAEQKPSRKPGKRPAVPGSIDFRDLDPDAVKIVRRLARNKHRAYLVGGCVRDLLLGHKPKDFDIGTSATPGQIKRLFRNCRIIGRRFRLAHIYFQGGNGIEVATFRSRESDDDNKEGKDLLIRDDNVFGTPAEDAQRRDFTINALFYDLAEEKVIDYADGLPDLKRRMVRTIGDPGVRFREDPIRMLRAIKFACRLDLVIEKNTLTALKEHRHDLDKAAMPRVLEEINRFCREGSAHQSFEMLYETGLFDVIFPEVARFYRDNPNAREMLLSMVAPMDPRQRHEIQPGEFFAALLMPVLIPGFGWKEDGTTERSRGFNLRSHVDDLLRPLALRMRVPRRDQEYCRQLLGTLVRMVPHERVRRPAKQAILRRECLTDAVRTLGLLGQRWGGEFAAAAEFWSSQEAAPTEPRSDGDRPSEGGEDRAPRRRGRRGRRGGRRRSGRGTSEETKSDAAERPARTDKTDKTDRPARPARPRGGPRDDNSFFAALPSLPEDESETDIGDRYGALNVAPPSAPEDAATPAGDPDETGENGPATEAEAQEGEQRPRRRRRRRRRPRRAEGTEGGNAPSADSDRGEGGTTSARDGGDEVEAAPARTDHGEGEAAPARTDHGEGEAAPARGDSGEGEVAPTRRDSGQGEAAPTGNGGDASTAVPADRGGDENNG